VDGQHQWPCGTLIEVEVVDEVAEDLCVLADVRSWVGAAVGRGVQALSVEEVVFDELVVRVETQRLVVDVAVLGVRADDDRGDPQSVSVLIDLGRDDVVVEPTPVVPGQKDRR
jgi:hypothetical protein